MIIPAIIPQTLEDLKEKLAILSFADRVQIDVVDGKFDNDVSWPYEPKGNVADVAFADRIIEVDLMAKDAVSAGREWLASGAKALIFHIESLTGPEEAVILRKEFDFELGFSASNDTELAELYTYIDAADFVQLMGIREIGAQGQPFDTRVLERIATIRHLYPKLVISVDGGVNLDTIESLKQAGVNRFVAGSAILRSKSPKEAYQALLKIAAPFETR